MVEQGEVLGAPDTIPAVSRDDEHIGTDPTHAQPGGSTQIGRPGGSQPAVSGDDDTATPEPSARLPDQATARADLESLPQVDARLYAVGMELGRGGMGRILAARDRKLRRNVVIKVLRAPSPGHQARFEREALITARLQHPSIVRVYDAGTLGGEPFYAMELVRGQSLDRVVAGADDAPARLALLPHVIAISEALAYAHSEGVIHRDLKPANVLVGSFGETVVIDWGLAKDRLRNDPDSIDPARRVLGPHDSAPPHSELTIEGAVMGTPSYMPPEQARGEPADERSDVYAIGAILYTVLSGTPPISGDRALDDARAGGIQPIRERAPETPDELVTIVEHAMAFDPAERYATARELADDLRRFAAGKLVARHSYTAGALIRRWLRRYRAPVIAAGAALAILGILSFVGVRQLASERDRAEHDATAATTALDEQRDRTDNLVIHQAESALATDPTTAVAWLQRLSERGLDRPRAREIADDAAARGIAFELAGPRGNLARVVVAASDAATAYTAGDDGHVWRWQLDAWRGDDLEGHAGPIEAIAASPDGWWLATAGTDRVVRLWRLFTGEIRALTGHAGAVHAVAFSPDGNTVASTSEDGALWLWTVETGAGRKAIADDQPLRPIVWGHDGKRLWAGAADGRVIEYDVMAGKQVATVRPHAKPVRLLALSPDGTRLASGGNDGAVDAWSVADSRVRSLGAHGDAVRDLAWAPDGRRLVSAGDGSIRVYDFAIGTTIVLDAGGARLNAIAISPDGGWVAAAGGDGAVRVWPISGGTPRMLSGHRAAVRSVGFSPNGARLLSAGDDRRLRLWPLEPPPRAPSGPGLAHWLAARTNVTVAQ